MEKALELISVFTSLCSLIVLLVSLWNIGKSIIKRLAIIQNKLNALKGILISLQGRVDDIEKYLTTHHGYSVRGVTAEIEKSFAEQYNDEDTGF